MTSVHERSRTIFDMLSRAAGSGRKVHVFYGKTTSRVYAFFDDHPNIIQAKNDSDFVRVGVFDASASVIEIHEEIIATIHRVEKKKGKMK